MIVQEIVDALSLTVLAGEQSLEKAVSGGYASDLLSCVMAGAKAGNVWVTLQAHPNVIAVAELLDLACVIITEGTNAHDDTLARANENDVAVLLSSETTFAVVSRLATLGVAAGA